MRFSKRFEKGFTENRHRPIVGADSSISIFKDWTNISSFQFIKKHLIRYASIETGYQRWSYDKPSSLKASLIGILSCPVAMRLEVAKKTH